MGRGNPPGTPGIGRGFSEEAKFAGDHDRWLRPRRRPPDWSGRSREATRQVPARVGETPLEHPVGPHGVTRPLKSTLPRASKAGRAKRRAGLLRVVGRTALRNRRVRGLTRLGRQKSPDPLSGVGCRTSGLRSQIRWTPDRVGVAIRPSSTCVDGGPPRRRDQHPRGAPEPGRGPHTSRC